MNDHPCGFRVFVLLHFSGTKDFLFARHVSVLSVPVWQNEGNSLLLELHSGCRVIHSMVKGQCVKVALPFSSNSFYKALQKLREVAYIQQKNSTSGRLMKIQLRIVRLGCVWGGGSEWVCVCVCVCVCARARACVRACVCVIHMYGSSLCSLSG